MQRFRNAPSQKSVLSQLKLRCYSSAIAVDLQEARQNRVERLIAVARVLIAGFSLLAVALNHAEPARHVQMATAMGVGYAVYALLLAVAAWRVRAFPGYLQFIIHALDLGVFLTFMHFKGPSGIFFVSSGYALASATLRWQWRGILWTALLILAGYSSIGAYATTGPHDPTFEPNLFIIHTTYLIVLAGLLGYVGAYQQRQYRQMSMLAAWPHAAPQDVRTLVYNTLEHVAEMLAAPRVIMAWEEPEEPWLNLAAWSRGELHWTREAPGPFDPLVAQPLVGTDFLCQNLSAPVPTVWYTASNRIQRWHEMPLHPDLQGRFAMEAVLSLSLPREALEGRLFVVDKQGMTSDDLIVGRIAAHKVAADLDQFYALQESQEAAVTAERKRTARDLHDGLLQSLTGMSVHLEMMSRSLENAPQTARNYLREIQDSLVDEQRDLRLFVQGLKQTPRSFNEPDVSLAARLGELSERLQHQWGLHVELNVESPQVWMPQGLVPEIYNIVHEALSNAARHADASSVRIGLSVDDTHVRITVADNGRGFPFRGHFDLTDLTTMQLGPKTLKERIAFLGGGLAIDSTAAGATLHISLPLTP